MSKDHNKRQVPIFNIKTGESRLSEPMPVRNPRVTGETSTPPISTTNSAQVPSAGRPSAGAESSSVVEPPQAAAQAPAPAQAFAEAAAGGVELAPKDGEPAKAKSNIETLEQFIAYAYARKGQRVVLKPKVERAIAGSPRLDKEATDRLMVLVEADVLLGVPRQLLLVSREVEGYPALRGALSSFVKDVMLRHPVFANSAVQDAVHNLPDAPSMANVMATVAGYAPARLEDKSALKPAELQALRRNATYLLATWFACNRGMNLEELTSLLLNLLWTPAARELADDNARLRALTEVEQFAGVGLICQRFQQHATEADGAQKRAERDADMLRSQVSQLEGQLQQANSTLETRTKELEELRARTAEELTQQRKLQETERMHLQHELEQLRGRLVRRLDESIEMLEVGLTALRNKTPRIEVMLERAEHVVDALRVEKNNLKEE